MSISDNQWFSSWFEYLTSAGIAGDAWNTWSTIEKWEAGSGWRGNQNLHLSYLLQPGQFIICADSNNITSNLWITYLIFQRWKVIVWKKNIIYYENVWSKWMEKTTMNISKQPWPMMYMCGKWKGTLHTFHLYILILL